MTTRRRLLISLLVVTGSLLVGLAAAEIRLRLAGISYPFPWTVDSERGLALRPGAVGVWQEEGLTRFRINKDGLRDGAHAIPKPPKILRIAVLGDSFSEARGSPRMSTPADAGNMAGHSDSAFRPPQGDAWRRAWPAWR